MLYGAYFNQALYIVLSWWNNWHLLIPNDNGHAWDWACGRDGDWTTDCIWSDLAHRKYAPYRFSRSMTTVTFEPCFSINFIHDTYTGITQRTFSWLFHIGSFTLFLYFLLRDLYHHPHIQKQFCRETKQFKWLQSYRINSSKNVTSSWKNNYSYMNIFDMYLMVIIKYNWNIHYDYFKVSIMNNWITFFVHNYCNIT